MKLETIDHNSPHLDRVKALGKANAATLGFLPEGAFDEHAERRNIIVAADAKSKCIGYCLYRITGRQATIAHLCVDSSHRKQGVARALVNYLKDITKDDLRGISLKCRRDYEASLVWPRFGFVAKRELPGRGKDRKPLTLWWFDHNHPNLFTESDVETLKDKVCVTLDANVFFDLSDPSRPGYEESSALLADWLPGSLELCVTDEIYNEIERGECDSRRVTSREFADLFTRPPAPPEKIDEFVTSLRPFFPEKMTARDESDLRQLARTLAAGLQFFITRDGLLLSQAEAFYEKFGVNVLRPSDLILRLDELRRESEYQPARLAGTLSRVQLLNKSDDPQIVETFLANSLGETKQSFKTKLFRILSKPSVCSCQVVYDTDGQPFALIAYGRSQPEELEIPLVRIRRGPLASTMARYLLFNATWQAALEKRFFTRITDHYLEPYVSAAIDDESFISSEGEWVKVSLPIAASAAEMSRNLIGLNYKHEEERLYFSGLGELLTKEYMLFNAQYMSDIEHILWPAKILDAQIPTFIVPIKAKWAKDLFDENLAKQTLFGAVMELALNRESAYYKSKNAPGGLKAPGRILWYVSQDKNYEGAMHVRACSRLDEVIIDKPKKLYGQFRRLGVYEWHHVYAVAKRDVNQDIMALRFSDTELFTSPVKWRDVQTILKRASCPSQLMSPHRIPHYVFAELYALGTERTA